MYIQDFRLKLCIHKTPLPRDVLLGQNNPVSNIYRFFIYISRVANKLTNLY